MVNHVVPTPLKILRGNPGQRRLKEEVQPAISENVPEPPEWLSDLAKDEWRRIAPELHALRLLTDIDLKIFAAYCSACARWERAERELKQGSLTTIRKTDGQLIPHPLTKVASVA